MRLRLVVLPVLVTLAFASSATVAASAQHAAAPDCTYTPKLPARVVISKPSVTFHTPVKITGGEKCKANFAASENLVHSTDQYELSWLYNSRTSSNFVTPVTVVPGIYRTQKSSATCSVTYNGTSPTCKVEPGSTVIKFGQKAHFTPSRLSGSKHDEVQFTAKATRYDQTETKYVTTRIDIQRLHKGKWHTIHSEIAKGKHGYVWTHTERKTAKYRAVSAQTSTSFSSTSRTVKV